MDKNLKLCIEIVSEQFLIRKSKNRSYSMRAFARDLDTSATSLSLFLKGKRPLTLETGIKWADELDLENETRQAFLEAITKENYKRLNPVEKKSRELEKEIEYMQLKLDQFSLISDWYHLAILNLTLTTGFKSDIAWISQKLAISNDICESAVARLMRLELLSLRDGKLVRTSKSIETPSDIASEGIKNFHRQNINRALKALDHVDVEERDITSIMMPIDLDKMAETKKRIRNFRKELAAFLKQESRGERVYSLNIQLFPQDTGLQ